jgi:hypothetical protein
MKNSWKCFDVKGMRGTYIPNWQIHTKMILGVYSHSGEPIYRESTWLGRLWRKAISLCIFGQVAQWKRAFSRL